LTPLGLCEWLRITPAPQWPHSYADLRKTGLGAWVVDWLELASVAGHTASERTTIAAFLYLLAQPEIHAALANDAALAAAYAATRERIQDLCAANKLPPDLDPELIDSLIAALADLSATRWPDSIFSLGEIE